MTDADLTPTPTKKRIEQRRWTVLFPVVALIALAAAGLVLFALGHDEHRTSSRCWSAPPRR